MFKVGDKVKFKKKIGTVASLCEGFNHTPLVVEFFEDEQYFNRYFTLDGKISKDDKTPAIEKIKSGPKSKSSYSSYRYLNN